MQLIAMQELNILFNLWLPSPLQKLALPTTLANGVDIYVKRDDLIHYHLSGNKYRKLKFNWQAFLKGDYDEIVAFGGAFSNLLYTLSFISLKSRVPMTFYIRGDAYDPENPTLKQIRKNGVEMHFLDRTTYRRKNEKAIMNEILTDHNKAFVIPDGGSNKLAIPGSAEILRETEKQLGKKPDYLLMDLGTAGTFSGVLAELAPPTKLIGIPVLKGVNWEQTILSVNETLDTDDLKKDIEIIEDYHFGGFAKFTPTLIEFINNFSLQYGIALDPIYTGKLVFALFDLLSKNYFRPESTIVWVHGGGLQGIDGFNYLNGPLINL